MTLSGTTAGQPVTPPRTQRGRPGRDGGRLWVGRSYVHLIFPVPALDSGRLELLDTTLAGEGWQVLPDNRPAGDDTPVLNRRWSNGQSTLVLVVLGWYPLLVTVGSEGRANAKLRRAERRLVEAAIAAGAREVADRELDLAVAKCRERWPLALAARQTIEDNARWLECRACRTCGAWSAYGALHCRGCARRFAPEDDAERNDRGRAAAATAAGAEQQLRTLGRGEGMFPDWPAPAAETRGTSEREATP